MVTDWLGIRLSIYISMGMMLLLRLGIVAVGLIDTLPHRGILATVLFFLMAPFMAMIQTVFQAANKRFTTTRSRSAGFSLWYLFMNVGAAAGGFMIDIVRKILGLPNAHIFTAGVATAILCIVVTMLMIRKENQLYGPGEKPAKSEEEENKPVVRKKPWQIAREVLTESTFWRLAVLIALLLGVRAVFTYMYLLMPKYWLRVIGPDAAIGSLQAINPIMIVFGLILFIPLANKFNIFSMLVYGSMVSASSLFVLVLPWQMFSSDIATAHYIMAAGFLILLTIGEIIWSPKLNEYTAAIAPEGQEGTYLGLTMVPWFLAKTFVSVLSGHMLVRWCPETVKRTASDIVAAANKFGFGADKVADSLPYTEVAAKAQNMGVDTQGLLSNIDVTALTAKAQALGINIADVTSNADLKTVIAQAKAFGLETTNLAQNADLGNIALQFKVVAMEVAQNILGAGDPSAIVEVNLKFAMVNKWLSFWHSPAAMWLVLGVFAISGSIIARLLRGWLTKGARWKIDHGDEADAAES